MPSRRDLRGRHLAFDYFDVPVSFGSDMDSKKAASLTTRINAALSQPVPLQLPAAAKALLAEHKARGRVQPPHSSAPAEAVHAEAPETAPGKTSLYLLVAANLVPLAGVILFDWQVADIMLLFWFESAIIGFFNILKMFRIAGAAAIFYSLFFLIHFGGFMTVHLLFIFGLFIEDGNRSATLPEVVQAFASLWPGVVALFISHGFSFRENFLRRREYLKLTLSEQMSKPYARVVVMHLTIILGGFMMLALKLQSGALVLLVLLKIGVDLSAHNKSHRVLRKK